MTRAADSTGRAGRALTTRRTAGEARANLACVLRLCQEGKLRWSEKSRRPGAATVALVTEVLQDGDFYPGHAIAAFAWPLLVQAGRLAELAGGRMQLTPRGRATLARGPSDALTGLWTRWPGQAPINEASSIWHLYIAEPRYGSLGYLGFHDWPLLEGRYALCVLFEYAATLGLIDVTYTDPAGARDDFRGNWGADDLDY